MDQKTIPSIIEQISPSWLTEKLSASGVLNGAVVQSFHYETIGTGKGFTGEVGRLSIKYANGDVDLPESVIIKSPNLMPEIRTNLLNLYVREYFFFTDAAQNTPLKTPRMYFGEVDIENERAIFLFEDLPQVKELGQQDPPQEQVMLALDQLARLHAAWWENPMLNEFDWLPSIDHGLQEIGRVFPQYWKTFKNRMAPLLPPEVVRIGDHLHENYQQVRARLARHPQTLLHGDFQGNNLLLNGASPPDLHVIDWQNCRRGRCMHDVAHFISLTVGVDSRRAHENTMLRHYHDRLLAYGVRHYSFEQALNDYKLSVRDHFFFLVVISLFLDFSENQSTLETAVDRIAQMVFDHHVS